MVSGERDAPGARLHERCLRKEIVSAVLVRSGEQKRCWKIRKVGSIASNWIEISDFFILKWMS